MKLWTLLFRDPDKADATEITLALIAFICFGAAAFLFGIVCVKLSQL